MRQIFQKIKYFSNGKYFSVMEKQFSRREKFKSCIFLLEKNIFQHGKIFSFSEKYIPSWKNIFCYGKYIFHNRKLRPNFPL
jgi:hypothetical protein